MLACFIRDCDFKRDRLGVWNGGNDGGNGGGGGKSGGLCEKVEEGGGAA